MSECHTCRVCGEEFDSKRGVRTHEGKKHTLPYKDKDELERMYWQQGLSLSEVADEFGVGLNTIQRWVDRLDIQTRQAPQDRDNPINYYFRDRNGAVGSEYEYINHTVDSDNWYVPIHRLIAIAYGELEPNELRSYDKVVHHKSEHGLDNRPGNIEVMDRGDHNRRHSDDHK